MRILLALLGLAVSFGAAQACEMHSKHTAVLASAATPTLAVPQASATMAVLPQSRIVEEKALSIPKTEAASKAYRRDCSHRGETVYLTQ